MQSSRALLRVLCGRAPFMDGPNKCYRHSSPSQVFIRSLLCADSPCVVPEEGVGLELPTCKVHNVLAGLFSRKQNQY